MRVGFLLVVALVILSLPCIELPECIGMYDDASNDFIVVQSQVGRPVCAPSVRAQHFAAANLQRRAVLTLFSSPLRSAPIPREGRSVLNVISIQKK